MPNSNNIGANAGQFITVPDGLVTTTTSGTAGDDTIIGNDESNFLAGRNGDDLLVGNKGNDTMRGGNGDDTMVWNNGDGSDRMIGGKGIDTAFVNGSDGGGDAFEARTVPGGIFFERTNLGQFSIDLRNVERLVLNGLAGNDTIDASGILAGTVNLEANGGRGKDDIFGSEGNDLLNGGDGADLLVGNKGDDTMLGGRGQDTMVWNNGDGSDRMIGGQGVDTAVVNGSDGSGDAFRVGNAPGGVFFERTNLGPFSLDIKQTEKLNLNGLDGDDTIDASGLKAGRVELRVTGGVGKDEILGSRGDDLLNGGNGADLLVGNKGDDTMIGAGGQDTMVWNNGDGSDVMDGGRGFDTAVVNGSNTAGDLFEVSTAPGGVLFERTNFGPFSIDIRDTEKLTLNGLKGHDTIDASGLDAGVIELRVKGGFGKDVILGSQGDDELIGDDGADLLVGNKGNDTMLGGQGQDTMVWNNGDGSDVMNGGQGVDTAIVNGSDGSGDLFEVTNAPGGVFFERTNFGPFSIDIQNTENLVLNGLGGDDTIDASALDAGAIALRSNGGEGDDVLLGSQGDDTLSGDAGNDILVGNRGNDVMLGGDGDDTIVWNNGDGSDTMDGGADEDTAVVNGSDGSSDAFEVSTSATGAFFQRTNLGPFSIDILNTETLVLNGLGGDDTINASGLDAGVLALRSNGGAGNDVLLGSQGDDTLSGDAGNDILVGNRGNDVMLGGDGDDTMIWNNGDGSDTMDGGNDEDNAFVNGSDASGDAFEVSSSPTGAFFQRTNLGPFSIDILNTENLGLFGLGGDDTIDASGLDAGVLSLRASGGQGNDEILGSQGNDTLSGDAGDDLLVGNRGNDVMLGGDGDDTMVWNNGDGSDTMRGGAGDDTAVVNGSDGNGDLFTIADVAGDVLFQRTNFGPFSVDIEDTETLVVNGLAGDDTIDASALDAGFISLDLNGGLGDDVIIGSDGDDAIDGGAGDDTIEGGAGNDLLTGGEGADIFVYTEGADTITDFEIGVDYLQIDNENVAAVSLDGDDTVFDFGDGSTLRLVDVQLVAEADLVF